VSLQYLGLHYHSNLVLFKKKLRASCCWQVAVRLLHQCLLGAKVDWLSGFHCEEQKQQLGDRKNTVIGQILSTTIGGKNGEPKQVS
jgi:hypothetical protein